MKDKWPHFPFSPAKFPFFYGWIIVAVSALGFWASIPGQTAGVGVFTDFLVEALGIDHVEISTAYMIGTIASSFVLPMAGKMLDHIGARIMTVISSIGLAVSLVLLAASETIRNAVAGDSFTATMVSISLIFFLIRFFGQGCLAMISRVTIGKWFDRRRGFAAAIAGVFIATGFGSAPVALNWLVEAFTWRSAAIILAVAVGIGMSLLGGLLYRDRPEDVGLLMDGGPVEEPDEPHQYILPTTKEFTRSEALRTFSFWAFSFAMATASLIVTAVTFHIASIGAEKALSRSAAYLVFVWSFPFSIGANIIGSWISDRIQHKYLMVVMMLAQFVALIGLLMFESFNGRMIFSISQGITGGLFGTLTTVVFPRFYGRLHLGEISGVNISILVFASAIGPILISGFRSLTGSYQLIFIILMVIPAALAIAGFWAKNPQPDDQ